MESVHHVNVPLRAGKKMKKRKELDALVAHSGPGKRTGGGVGGGKRNGGGGASSQDQLLSESTDEQDDYWSGKDRGSSGGGSGPRCRLFLRRRVCGSLLRACTAALVFACVVATTTVMWLFIDIREQVTSLRNELDQVVAGSQGVPDALQKCHSQFRELQQNQTMLFNQLSTLTQQLKNYSTQLVGVQVGLQSVEDRLKAAPELVNLPKDVQSISTSVASFGSQIRDLNTTVTLLKNDNSQLQEASKTLAENVTTLKQKVALLANATQHPQAPSRENIAQEEHMLSVMKQLSSNLTLINNTLSKKLQWVADDQVKDHKSFVNLQDVSQNVSARLTTLEGDCVKIVMHSALNTTVEKLFYQVNKDEEKISDLDVRMTQLQAQTEQLESNSTWLIAQVSNIGQIVNSLEHSMEPAEQQLTSRLQDSSTQRTEAMRDESSP
ncbi:EF-hand calcium-binding domain-containing protein 14-like isoform X1 [Periplaneta americana]|uniref:EF-hand calcium-binding domain-containing protein 14-like isoform X1 n=1 Tax=Periplaneta americana TaxID=6978 RepID=UPI0037E71800